MSKSGGSTAAAGPHQLDQQCRRDTGVGCHQQRDVARGRLERRGQLGRKSGGADQQRRARRAAGRDVRAGRRRHAEVDGDVGGLERASQVGGDG